MLNFILIPFFAGLICLVIPRKLKYGQEIVSLAGSAAYLLYSIQSFSWPDKFLQIPWFKISFVDFSLDFRFYSFSRFILLFLGLFTLVTALYSTGFFQNKKVSQLYFPFILWTLSGASLIALADNFFIFLIGWEIVTLLLFFLIAMSRSKPAAMAAGKAFAILGFTDVALLFAVLALPVTYGSWKISTLQISVSDPLSVSLFILMFIAAIAKAGAIPLHSWIPTAAESAPLPVIAFLPAALDKLLGIYLLARITLDVFVLPPNSSISLIIMIVGALTIIVGVLIAVVQHDLKRLLSYHAISQVGYMVLGIGTGNPIGVAGGIFHMLNHAIYKSCLFFNAGSVELRAKTTDINKLGGLAKFMPVTFITCLIAALSISGVPPFNGFVSKWMVYQGLVEGKSSIHMIFLITAMFGSALTLASFLKLLFGTFLGQKFKADTDDHGGLIPKSIKEVNWTMLVPVLILAFLCILFGIFAQFPINKFISPVIDLNIGRPLQGINLETAFWNPTLATFLLLLGLFIGAMIYLISKFKVREVESLFIGGEKFQEKSERVLAGNFYEFLGKIKFLGVFLSESNKGILDVYNLSSGLGQLPVNVLKKLHDGILSTYLAWCIIGLGIICFILIVF